MTRLSVLITLLVVAALIAGSIWFFFWYRGRLRSQREKEYRAALKQNWSRIGDRAAEVTAALTRVSSTADFDGVVAAADAMRAELHVVKNNKRTESSPGRYKKLHAEEKASLESMEAYTAMLSELASRKDQDEIEKEKDILENRARKALTDYNDFSSDAPFLNTNIGAEFFNGWNLLENAYRLDDSSQDAEKESAYETVKKFMDADLKDYNIDIIWSLLSSTKQYGLEYFGVTKERLASGWREAWGEDEPVDYYVSHEVSFPDASTALVKVIVYYEEESPRIEDIRLVKEPDGWRLDSYPFVGFE